MAVAVFFSDDILTQIFKRLPEKSLLRFKCVQKSWYHLIKSPYFTSLHSDHQKIKPGAMYMFAHADHSDHGMILYRIDPLPDLRYYSDPTHLHDLRPLFVFPTAGDDHGFGCIKFGSKIYFIGLDYYFSRTENYQFLSGESDVYTIDEKDLMGIEPSKDNDIRKFKHLLTKTKNPLHGHKSRPICFVADNKLYVLSRWRCTMIPFEVFSPVDETWQVLPDPFDVCYEDLRVSHLLEEKERIFYFALSNRDIVSFNLETHEWTLASTRAISFSTRNRFSRQAILVDEMAFGYLDNYLAPDQDFLEVLRSSHCTYMNEVARSSYTDYIVALRDSDNKEVLCIVTYSSNRDWMGNYHNRTKNYVALSLFDIPGGFYTTDEKPVQKPEAGTFYADEKTEDGGVIRRYFNAKFRYTKHFIIRDLHLLNVGDIVTCFV